MKQRCFARLLCAILWAASIHWLAAAASAETAYTPEGSLWRFPAGYCTYFAATEFERIVGSKVNWDGHAHAWFENATTRGWKTGTNPWEVEAGALLVWSGGRFGHVAVVQEVAGDRVVIREMNAGNVLVDARLGITDEFNVVQRRYLYRSNQFRRSGMQFVGAIHPIRTPTPTMFVSSRRCWCIDEQPATAGAEPDLAVRRIDDALPVQRVRHPATPITQRSVIH